MKKLAINFYAQEVTDAQLTEFHTAIDHELKVMQLADAEATFSRLEKRVSNLEKKLESATTEERPLISQQIDGIRSQLTELEAEKEALTASIETTKELHASVVSVMSQKNDDGFGNNADTVRTVLRVLACWDNSRLVKYAIIPAFQSPALYEALETIHVLSKAGENGELSMTKEVKEAYKTASGELENIIKNTFSLPFATHYTDKTRVKLTAADKKLLNDCYVRGFSNKFSVEDTGVVSFKKRTINTLVRSKKDKKTDTVTYDYSGLASTIANIVLMHYFAE